MKVIYNLLHFANKTQKRLCISIPDTGADVNKVEGVLISIVGEDSQTFALSTTEIKDFIIALSYGAEMLQMRRIAALNAKFGEVK